MEKQYRNNYLGEFIIHGTNKVQGEVIQEREWIPNTITNRNTGMSLVIGNGSSRQYIDINFNLLINHKGGLHANKKLTVYGCNALHRDTNPHFLIVRHPEIAKEVVESGYADNNIVITGIRHIKKYPDKFHLIPFDKNMCAGATALYLAAFDKHNHIYFMGFDGQDSPHLNNNIYAGTHGYGSKTSEIDGALWEKQCKEVFDTYENVDFVRVVPGTDSMPESWKYCPNVRQISSRQFISECDIGVT